MTSSLRCPAISRLQKVHNVQVALNALVARGASLEASRGGAIEARDVVDGHREKTLQLLWRLIFHFQVEQIIDVARLRQEITFLRKELLIKRKLAALEQDLDPDSCLGTIITTSISLDWPLLPTTGSCIKLCDAMYIGVIPSLSTGIGSDRRDSVQASELYTSSERLQLLLRWCKLVCAHYDVKVGQHLASAIM